MKNKNVEVEGGELLLMSEEGHYAVIPAKHRSKVKTMIDDNCNDCINNYIKNLPKESAYAKDGSLVEAAPSPFEDTSGCGGPGQPDCPEVDSEVINKEDNFIGPTQDGKELEIERTTRTDIDGWIPGIDIFVDETRKIPDQEKNFKNLVEKFPEVDYDSYIQNKSQEEFKNWYTNPETRKRMKEQTGLSDDKLDDMIIHGLKAKKVDRSLPPGVKGRYDQNTHELIYKKGDTDTGFHETIHSSGLDAVLDDELMKVLGSPFNQEEKNNWEKVKRYMSQSHEAYSNFSEFRNMLGLKPGEKVDKDKFYKLIKKKEKAKESNFYNTFDGDRIIEAINTIASTSEKDNKNVS